MATQIQEELEDQIKRRVAIGSDARVKRLVDEFSRKGFPEFAVGKHFNVLARGELQQHQRKVVQRVK